MTDLMFPTEVKEHTSVETLLKTLSAVILSVNLIMYVTIMTYLFVKESDPILRDLKQRDKNLQQKNLELIRRKSKEFDIEDEVIKKLPRNSEVLNEFSAVINNSGLQRSISYKTLKNQNEKLSIEKNAQCVRTIIFLDDWLRIVLICVLTISSIVGLSLFIYLEIN